VQDAKPNLSVLEEYRRREQEYSERAHDLAEVTRLRDTVKAEQDSLMKARLDEFMQGFNIITQKLKEMYQVSQRKGKGIERFFFGYLSRCPL
jgi:structural maintenance of chromosome 4